MTRRFEPTKAQQRAIEKALARMDQRRHAKARKAAERSARTNARRREEKLAERKKSNRGYIPAPEREARAIRSMRLAADRHDRSALRWIASADRARDFGDLEKSESRRRSAETFRKRARTIREMADERESGVLRDQPDGVADTTRVTNELRQKLALPAWKVLLARMESGAWHVMADLIALMPEYSRSTVKALVVGKMLRDGWLERAGHPDYDGTRLMVPRYLYRVAQDRTQAAQEWRSDLGMMQEARGG